MADNATGGNGALKGVLTSTVGRWVAAGFALVVAPLTPSLVNFSNDVLGQELTDAQVQAYSGKASLAVAGVVVTWLLNRGLFERKALDIVAPPETKVEVDVADGEGDFEDETYDGDGEDHVPDEIVA